MNLFIELEADCLPKPINYTDKVLSIGSCFAENIAQKLEQYKFDALCNPHGILFSPLMVAESLLAYVHNKEYTEDDLFYQNELWNSWEHHSRFSNIDKEAALQDINASVSQAHEYIKSASHLVITYGTAYQYYLQETGQPVSNNHKVPSDNFEKILLPAEEIVQSTSEAIDAIMSINPDIQIILTVSPVRHLRDGVINNNRSKARLIESVHQLCAEYDNAYYFPAYELVVDVLRDYRFYAADMAHPSEQSVDYVWQKFTQSCLHQDAFNLLKDIEVIVSAAQHRPRFPDTEAHKKFLAANAQKVGEILSQHPYLNLGKELAYFNDVVD